MKIVTYILIGLLVVTLGGGAYLYLYQYSPMAAEYQKMQQGQPEFEKARKELKKYADREKQEAGWTGAAAEALRKGLANEIAAGKAEVVVAGSRVIVNIAEAVLYTPQSVTFARDAKPALDNLAALLREYKDKEIFVGNMTQAAPAQGKGRKRVPAKDARTLSSGRSVELVKYLEKNGVPMDTLIASSYPAKMPDRGFTIKEQKTVIVIAFPASAGQAAPAQKTETKPEAAVKTVPAVTAAPAAPAAAQPKSIPISTVPPKKAQ
jgi:outer membrane protein OmpA-like peptidoglycan-associated protein